MVLNTLLNVERAIREYNERQRAAPEDRLRHRQEMKSDIAAHLRTPKRDAAARLIIRDVARMDEYPDVDQSLRGISPWFPVEAHGTYHRGLEVALRVEELVVSRGRARPPRRRGADRCECFLVCGWIPYDAIVTIDWVGDEYYARPHIYSWYRQAHGPFERFRLYERGPGSDWRPAESLTYAGRRPSVLRAWKLRVAQRRFEREVLKGIDRRQGI